MFVDADQTCKLVLVVSTVIAAKLHQPATVIAFVWPTNTKPQTTTLRTATIFMYLFIAWFSKVIAIQLALLEGQSLDPNLASD